MLYMEDSPKHIDDIPTLRVVSFVALAVVPGLSLVRYFGIYIPDPISLPLGFAWTILWIWSVFVTPRHCRAVAKDSSVQIIVLMIGCLFVSICILIGIGPDISLIPMFVSLIGTIRGIDWQIRTPRLWQSYDSASNEWYRGIEVIHDFFAVKAKWVVPLILVIPAIVILGGVVSQVDRNASANYEREKKAEAIALAKQVAKQQELEMRRELALQAERDRIESEKRKAELRSMQTIPNWMVQSQDLGKSMPDSITSVEGEKSSSATVSKRILYECYRCKAQRWEKPGSLMYLDKKGCRQDNSGHENLHFWESKP